ncbi:hypothetical protein DUPY_39480 [Duganella phyllosphaerae]|uniref:Uncharacterized protein n=1 Tax=Duganella phyllosphaerae TaxID=762836 RepID=A0A1E7WE21_9BURK|nr:hypothetical protein DUPY_39480 [Duganella phyllosphaerae]
MVLAPLRQPVGQDHWRPLRVKWLGERQQAGDQGFQPLYLQQGRVQRRLGAGAALVGRCRQRVVHLHADGAERIADLMREPGRQAAQRSHPFAGHQQARQPLHLAAPAREQHREPGARQHQRTEQRADRHHQVVERVVGDGRHPGQGPAGDIGRHRAGAIHHRLAQAGPYFQHRRGAGQRPLRQRGDARQLGSRRIVLDAAAIVGGKRIPVHAALRLPQAAFDAVVFAQRHIDHGALDRFGLRIAAIQALGAGAHDLANHGGTGTGGGDLRLRPLPSQLQQQPDDQQHHCRDRRPQPRQIAFKHSIQHYISFRQPICRALCRFKGGTTAQ